MGFVKNFKRFGESGVDSVLSPWRGPWSIPYRRQWKAFICCCVKNESFNGWLCNEWGTVRVALKNW